MNPERQYSTEIEIKGTVSLLWLYPEIYNRNKQDAITLSLMHTRAADDIRIRYDSGRDGWMIEQAAVFEWDAGDKACDMEWAEVAFIKAWARQKISESKSE